jgi:TolB-like protein/DNA-binding winged helix-turn-helix (wHTH) protein/Tfp pilus assembly protein PilF
MKLRFGLFDFDAAAGELRRDGDFVKLPPQPARLLASLLRRAGEVVTRDELRRELWGADTFVDFERSLNFCVQQVRAALGDSSDNPRFIQTVPRRGYRFIAPVSIVTAHEHPAPLKPPSSPLAFPVPRRHLWLAVPATTLIVLLLAAWLIPFNIAAPRHTPAPASRPTRVVVLPFANLTGDESASYLADGLTDELIARLGAMGGDALAVIARTSAMTYRNTSKTITDIGKELDVAFVVEGSVRRDAGGLRISGSLVPVQQQTAIARWDESFDSGEGGADARNTFAAIRLARLVAIRLLPSAKVSAPQTTADPDAWDALLQANAAIERGTADDARRAVSSLEHAVTVDPGFAGAWAQLAQVKHLLVMMGVERPADAYARAQEAADSAVRLDPQLASAHIAHGLVALWYDWQPARAARDFERALSLNASDAAAHHDYAWSLVALDRADEAVRHMLTARDLDPLSTRANNDIGWLHLQLRQPADAARACEHTLAMDGSSLEAQACLERAYAGRQLYDAALAAARTATPPDATFSGARHSTTAADTLRQLWRWRLDRLQHASESRWINPYTLAVQYALVGDTARALDALESAYDERVGMLVFLKRDPAFDTLRQEPRFDELIRRVSEKAF